MTKSSISISVLDDCLVNSNFPVYNDCSVIMAVLIIVFVLLTKTLLYFMTVLSIDETHDHHDLYSSICSSVTMIVVLKVTFLFTITVLYILALLIIVCPVYKDSCVS